MMAELTLEVPDGLSEEKTAAMRDLFSAYVRRVVEICDAAPDLAFDAVMNQAATETALRDRLALLRA